jgi:hypothetical protein
LAGSSPEGSIFKTTRVYAGNYLKETFMKKFLITVFLIFAMFQASGQNIPDEITTSYVEMNGPNGQEVRLIGTAHFGTADFFRDVIELAGEDTPVIHGGTENQFPRFMLTYIMCARIMRLYYEWDRLPHELESWQTVDISKTAMNNLLNQWDVNDPEHINNQNLMLVNMYFDWNNKEIYQNIIRSKIQYFVDDPDPLTLNRTELIANWIINYGAECAAYVGETHINILIALLQDAGYVLISRTTLYPER